MGYNQMLPRDDTYISNINPNAYIRSRKFSNERSISGRINPDKRNIKKFLPWDERNGDCAHNWKE